MGVVVSVLVHLPEFWVFISALCVSCAVLAVFLWRMEAEIKKSNASGKKGGSAPGAAALFAEMGFDYDARQDALVSRFDAWQRQYGYSRIYDEAAARCGLIVHCEPVAFEYEGRRYILALWKGQYGLAAGAEIGLYVSEGQDAASGAPSGTVYACAPDDDCPDMEMTLFYRDSALFSFKKRHWWLAGYRAGFYARPEALVLRGAISFKSAEMAQAAYNALFTAGYTPWEIGRIDETVCFTFARPHTPQPVSQRGLRARIKRLELRLAVSLYRRAVRNLKGMDDIAARLREKSPALFALLLNSARGRRLLDDRGVPGMSGKERE